VLRPGRPAGRLEVGGHALLAAGDLQQLAVELDVPGDVEPDGGERSIEGDTMAVALRVDENAVAVEDQCLHRDAGAYATFARTSPARLAPPNCWIFSLKSAFNASN